MTENTSSIPDGMTLRDWFAAQVDTTKIVEFNSLEDAAKFLGEECPPLEDMEAGLAFSIKVQAKIRYMFADIMLEYSQGDNA